MFNKILIANRGEIACRIIHTAKKMGIKTVAVYSDADTTAQHVKLADEAFYIGRSPAKDSYLQSKKIIEIALKSGAEAIHPGYGFLSENADFAELCSKNNIEFIGPPVSAITSMGSKSAAKSIMTRAKIPLVPGYHGENQEPDFLLSESIKIGFPVLLKAIAGGGGKGMRIVSTESEFFDMLTACKREAISSFGNDQVLVEKYLKNPRHVEIQVFADKHGNFVHLFERDCSVQRRHQKVIEEAPAPNIPAKIRKTLGEVAIQSAKAISYVGAGTVEFLYDGDDKFYFMEMNTRLQVEHPVTEMITSQDLVEWQLKVASGEILPLKQEQIIQNGHAFEVRIYAEDPNQDFLPAIGNIQHLKFPQSTAHVRIDSGIVENDEIGIYYDPMIAKLIVWDQDRESALRRLKLALSDCQIAGLTTNLPFLAAIATNASFNSFDIDTSFIEREHHNLFSSSKPIDDETLAIASIYLLLKRQQQAEQEASKSNDPYSPWNQINGWRLNKDNFHSLKFSQEFIKSNTQESESVEHQVIVHFRKSTFLVEIKTDRDCKKLDISGELNENGQIFVTINQRRSSCHIVQIGETLIIFNNGITHNLIISNQQHDSEDTTLDNNLTAPMPGTIISLLTKAGETVKAGTKLLILEAMKMEHTITAPSDGTIKEIFFNAGEQVQEGAQLFHFVAD